MKSESLLIKNKTHLKTVKVPNFQHFSHQKTQHSHLMYKMNQTKLSFVRRKQAIKVSLGYYGKVTS